jgi:nicotinamidase-related amidase
VHIISSYCKEEMSGKVTVMRRKTSNMEENESSISVTNSATTSNATVNDRDRCIENITHNTLQKPRYAVLVLDMLNDFVYGKLKCEGAKEIIPEIVALVNAARQRNIPIFYCIDQHLPTDIHELKLWGYHAMKGTKGADIINELKPSTSNDHIIHKRTYSAFDKTGLDKALKSAYGGIGAETLIITGLTTDICSRHTAYDAFTRGFNIVVAEDGTTSFTQEDHVAGLKYMQRDYGVQVTKIDDIKKDFEKTIKGEENNNINLEQSLSFR